MEITDKLIYSAAQAAPTVDVNGWVASAIVVPLIYAVYVGVAAVAVLVLGGCGGDAAPDPAPAPNGNQPNEWDQSQDNIDNA